MDPLRSLGPKTGRALAEAGITSLEQLRRVGAVVAFVKARRAGAPAGVHLLWALEGALHGTAWRRLPRSHRVGLLFAAHEYERAMRRAATTDDR